MTKYVIDTVELIKRVYVVDAYTKEEAIKKMEDQYPRNTEVLSNTIFDIHTINEHEYNKDWKDKWGGERPEKISNRQRELFEESNDIWRDD